MKTRKTKSWTVSFKVLDDNFFNPHFHRRQQTFKSHADAVEFAAELKDLSEAHGYYEVQIKSN